MCFKNLPIEFDEQGNASLSSNANEPFGYEPVKNNPGNPAPATANITEFKIDPITRVAGALGFNTRCDLNERKVVEAHSMATLFRGYELILKGRQPSDAIDISSRACGVCGAVHSTCASMALEMAYQVVPPPLGVVARTLGETAEFLYDHPLHLFLLAGPDYSEMVVKSTNPELWDAAQKTSAPHRDVHEFKTIGEIMTGLNPLSGKLYLEAFEITRLAREMCCLMYGKYPHPSTLVPGGVTTTFTFTSFNDYYSRLVKLIDYSKKVVAIWDDVFDFFYEQNPDYKKVGARPVNMIGTGVFDDPDAYDASYQNCNDWGKRRWATPGVLIDGELRTTDLQKINIGIEEFVEHSFYDEWNGHPMPKDPAGGPLSPNHPWNKQTLPKPVGRSFKEKYSWSTSPRWDRTVMEAGAYTRIWITALAQKQPESPFIHATGKSLKMLMPKAQLPEMELEWRIPDTLNAIERNRARAYCMPWMCQIAMMNLQKAFALFKQGETKAYTKFDRPRKGTQVGVGFWEAGRGYLTHYLIVEDDKIKNYQILTPSTWNASPIDPFGNPGAYEEAVLNSPILETFSKPEDFKGIDIQRTIRSFDPCMPCTTHIHTGTGFPERVITRDVTSCVCGFEDELDLHGHAKTIL